MNILECLPPPHLITTTTTTTTNQQASCSLSTKLKKITRSKQKFCNILVVRARLRGVYHVTEAVEDVVGM